MIEISESSMLVKLSNYPAVIELLTRCEQDQIEHISKITEWSPTLLSNLQKYDNSILHLLEKLQPGDRIYVKDLITWPAEFISQITKLDNNFIDVVNKIDAENKQKLTEIIAWPPTLTALISKDHSVLDFLTRLSIQDKTDIGVAADWKNSTLSLIKHNRDFFKFLIGLTKDELNLFRSLLSWPSSVFYQLIENKQVVSDYKTHILSLYRMWDIVNNRESFFRSYMTLHNTAKAIDYSVVDAFSKGQIDSKLWLISELDRLGQELGNVWCLCGWIGSLSYMINNSKNDLKFNHIRSFDIDPRCAGLADKFNKDALLSNWKFKASTIDVNSLKYADYKFATLKSDGTTQYIQESANTVINTSCDHMNNNTWWERIPSGTLVVLQNNNFEEKEEHVNTVASLAEFKNRYPMHSVLYEGELDCNFYTRYMLIGVK